MPTPLFSLSFETARTEVFVGAGILEDKELWCSLIPEGYPVVIVADVQVAEEWYPRLFSVLKGYSLIPAFLPSGEETKTRSYKAKLEDLWIYHKVPRESIAIALGGGVMGDLVGFTAATYLRGISHIQVPTTLLAMVDSSLGGKTAVDHPLGKNLIGAFHPARALVADIRTLKSLPHRVFKQGMVEAVKHAIVRQRELFDWMEEHLEDLLHRREDALLELVKRNLRIKGEVVELDPREADLRQILNFGHTLGHALEQASGYHLPHGEAIALGMVGELELACEVRGFPRAEARRIVRLLRRMGPWEISHNPDLFDLSSLLKVMSRDKKVRAGAIRFSLPQAIGSYPPHPRWGYSMPVDPELIPRALQAAGSL